MNTILETAMGLALVYLLVSMFASSVQEIFARYRGSRGQFLREGLLSIITDRWTYLRTINHPSIVAFYRNAPGRGHAPSYLPPDTVALALCDVLVRRYQLQRQGGVVFDLKVIKEAVRDAKDRDTALGHALLPLVEGANTFDDALKAVARWYEQGMDRVSGWYKAYAQRRLFVIGLVIATAFNIDTLSIVEALDRSTALRAEMAAVAGQVASYRAEVDRLRVQRDGGGTESKIAGGEKQIEQYRARLNELAAAGLPIGYACLGTNDADQPAEKRACTPPDSWLLKIAGLLLTALAAALGAPFWFDLINRLISLRAGGAKPGESKKA